MRKLIIACTGGLDHLARRGGLPAVRILAFCRHAQHDPEPEVYPAGVRSRFSCHPYAAATAGGARS